jgi:hypothetical protein
MRQSKAALEERIVKGLRELVTSLDAGSSGGLSYLSALSALWTTPAESSPAISWLTPTGPVTPQLTPVLDPTER